MKDNVEMVRKARAAGTLRHAPQGMTLIEILVVIAIIGIVATVVAVGVVGAMQSAKVESAKTLVENVASACGIYAVTKKRLPKDLGELVAGKFIKKNQVKDPWDFDLEYQPGHNGGMDDFTLCSVGPDGSGGSEDDICAGGDDDD